MNDLELSNAEGLDESIMNAIGMTDNMEYSSCCGADGENFSYGTGDAIAQLGATLQGSLGGGTGSASTSGTGTKSGGTSIDPDKVKKGIEIGTALLGNIGKGRTTGEADVDAICGKKPFCVEFFGNGCNSKKEKYRTCVDRIQKRKSEAPLKAQELELEKQRLQAQIEQARLEAQRTQQTDTGDKFLGMPKAVGITVTVVGGLALIVGGIFLVRKLRKG